MASDKGLKFQIIPSKITTDVNLIVRLESGSAEIPDNVFTFHLSRQQAFELESMLSSCRPREYDFVVGPVL